MKETETVIQKEVWQRPELQEISIDMTKSGANPYVETMTSVGNLSS